LNKLDNAPPEEETKPATAASVALTHFTLPPPPPLESKDVARIGKQTVHKVLDILPTLGERGKKSKAGINRLAASAYDRDAWITVLTRLASRASAGLEQITDVFEVKVESNDMSTTSIANTIRESLYLYIIEDFRKRIDTALTWLCEEWYNDRIQQQSEGEVVAHYDKWVLKIMDGMVPFLDGQDRSIVIKFLGEIPGLSMEVLDRVKDLCRNPATATMALQSLLFLVAYRPPVRELVLNAVEEIWVTCKQLSTCDVSCDANVTLDEDTRTMATKLFSKYRPGLGERLKAADDNKEELKLNGSDALAVTAS
jgi:symplekin